MFLEVMALKACVLHWVTMNIDIMNLWVLM